MTRETGIKMVEKYATIQPEALGLFLNWIDMSESEFFNHIDKFRDEKAWQKVDSTWMLRDSITNHRISADSFLSDIKDDCVFRITDSAEPSLIDNKYLLMGRGYIDSRNYGAQENEAEIGGMTKRNWLRPSIK